VTVDGHDLAGLHFALEARADDVQRARLRRKDHGLAESAHHERTPAARVARREQRVADADEQGVGPLDAPQRVGEARFRGRRVRLREAVHDDLGIHRRGEDRARRLELRPQLGGVDEVAVVRERQVAAARSREDRLRVLDRRRAGGAVAGVADGEHAVQAVALGAGHEAHSLHHARRPCLVDRHDAERFLTAVLERVQSETRQLDRVGVPVYAEDAAHSAHRALEAGHRRRGRRRGARHE
jgi:hypothetical protein